MLHPGLYEQVINTKLQSELAEIPQARKDTAPIDRAEASHVLSQYLADIVQKGLDNVLDNGGDIAAQVALTNQIVTLIQASTQEADFAALSVAEQAEQLLALLREADPRLAAGKTAADFTRPETSMAQSSLCCKQWQSLRRLPCRQRISQRRDCEKRCGQGAHLSDRRRQRRKPVRPISAGQAVPHGARGEIRQGAGTLLADPRRRSGQRVRTILSRSRGQSAPAIRHAGGNPTAPPHESHFPGQLSAQDRPRGDAD